MAEREELALAISLLIDDAVAQVRRLTELHARLTRILEESAGTRNEIRSRMGEERWKAPKPAGWRPCDPALKREELRMRIAAIEACIAAMNEHAHVIDQLR